MTKESKHDPLDEIEEYLNNVPDIEGDETMERLAQEAGEMLDYIAEARAQRDKLRGALAVAWERNAGHNLMTFEECNTAIGVLMETPTESKQEIDRPDPAAVFGIAMALHDWGCAEGNVSEAYQGADQFMRECMRVGEVFETWACVHVDFDQLDDVWPYMLHDKFAEACIKACVSVLNLDTFGPIECVKVALALGLTLRTGGAS